MKGAELFVSCLENEGIDCVYGIPGEENIDVMDAILDSKIKFVTTRHEQGAAFMADVYGRLTGRAGVCLATLGPGATNLVTGIADANMDLAPVVAIAGQGATTRLHKESHQILDLVKLFEPITKYSTQILDGSVIPEVVRKAFKVAETEKPGCSFIDFPENIAGMSSGTDGLAPLKVQKAQAPCPPDAKLKQAAAIIGAARHPLLLAGNGVIRGGACPALQRFAEKVNVPVASTFMAKGVLPFSHPLSLGSVGLQAHDYVSCGFDRADVVICVGYDIVEYHPDRWNPDNKCKIIHIGGLPAEVDSHYMVEAGLIGDIAAALDALAGMIESRDSTLVNSSNLRQSIVDEMESCAADTGFPVKPQKIVWDLRQALAPDDIVISDVGAHKMWMARMYQAERPNTCIISNGFASMGIAVPGAFAAARTYPDRKVVAVTGDAGFLMNSQEIETALRHKVAFVILVWTDCQYGLIKWHQLRKFNRDAHISFTNPDLVKYAESFGAKGYRVEAAAELLPTLRQALSDDRVSLVECPVDYRENMKLTEHLGELVCPI
ncbi:MAG: acetolactate synthase large subunit [Candidatus Porifericomitaceae bacterium WSBS_2022_MAG_OTU9]